MKQERCGGEAPYRSIDIFFMSGTGNTFRVARVFAEAEAGASVGELDH